MLASGLGGALGCMGGSRRGAASLGVAAPCLSSLLRHLGGPDPPGQPPNSLTSALSQLAGRPASAALLPCLPWLLRCSDHTASTSCLPPHVFIATPCCHLRSLPPILPVPHTHARALNLAPHLVACDLGTASDHNLSPFLTNGCPTPMPLFHNCSSFAAHCQRLLCARVLAGLHSSV